LYRKQPALVLSESTRNDLVQLGFSEDRIHVLASGCSGAATHSVPRVEGFSFLYVGRITPSKRVDHIIKAYAIARLSLPAGMPSRLSIVGKGAPRYERRLRHLAARAGVSQSITFYGWVDHLWQDHRIAGSHALVLASVREGWGLVVNEANAHGMPAVGYPVSGLRDSIQDGITGLLARDQTPEALAEAMVRLATSPQLFARLSRAASSDASGRDWSTSRRVAQRELAAAASQLRAVSRPYDANTEDGFHLLATRLDRACDAKLRGGFPHLTS